MLKFNNTFVKVIALILTLAMVSCQFNGIKGSGNVTTENRNISGFNSIKVENGMDVVLEQSTETSVTVIADDNVQKHIITTVNGSVLKITSDVHSFFNVKSS